MVMERIAVALQTSVRLFLKLDQSEQALEHNLHSPVY